MPSTSSPAEFSPDYATARQRFRIAIERRGWHLESHPIGHASPAGEPLTIDVGCSPGADCDKALVISSGVHGVEGFFGSAVQLALLERLAHQPPPGIRCVLLHGLNPYGFAWLRRTDEHNVDLNRNFLLPEAAYSGAPPGYDALNGLLNPQRPPRRSDLFLPRAFWTIARQGMRRVRGAVATGQYSYPQGLFYGGDRPARSHQLLDQHLPRWLAGAQRVVHLDFHTGLGRHGTCKLLINHPLSADQRARLDAWFGAEAYESAADSSIAYQARGEFGRWCAARGFASDYLFACAEYGTYPPIRVLAGLRAENQAHHWADPAAACTTAAKRRLQELFCPAAPRWRFRVLQHSLALVDRAVQGLSALRPGVASTMQ